MTNSSKKDIYAYNRPEFTYEQVVWIFREIENWSENWCKTAIKGEKKFLEAKDTLLKTLCFDKDLELSFSGKRTFRDIPVKYRSYILNQDGTLSCPYCEKVVNCA